MTPACCTIWTFIAARSEAIRPRILVVSPTVDRSRGVCCRAAGGEFGVSWVFRRRGCNIAGDPCDATCFLPQVGFDPSNRSGLGGNTGEVLLLAADIAEVGWSWAATSHAVCIEVSPGDVEVERFNAKLCDGTGLAPVEQDSIKFGSLSCGHTNMGLRAIAAGVPSSDPLLSADGRMCLSRLDRTDAEYAKAVRQGLRWKVLRHSVRSRYPKVLDIIQAGVETHCGHWQCGLRASTGVRTYVGNHGRRGSRAYSKRLASL